MGVAALIIIHNHRHDANIPLLDRIYSQRFNTIFHLIPFYDGHRQNVISVYEKSLYFQGYIAQAYKTFYDPSYTHYFFVADDIALNPIITDTSYSHYLHLTDKSSFIPSMISLHDVGSFWPRVTEAYMYNIDTFGVQARHELPTYTEALNTFKKHGLTLQPIAFRQIYNKPKFFLAPRSILSILKYFFLKVRYSKHSFFLPYPLIGSYSDIFVVSSYFIKEFCRLCGIFATTNLFVELAIPTALVLSSPTIVTEATLSLKGHAIWTERDSHLLDRYTHDLNKLFDMFPSHLLYIHPVKLTQWRFL